MRGTRSSNPAPSTEESANVQSLTGKRSRKRCSPPRPANQNPLNFVNNFAQLSVELLDELKDTTAPAVAALGDDKRVEVDETIQMLTGNLEKIAEHGRRADGIVKRCVSIAQPTIRRLNASSTTARYRKNAGPRTATRVAQTSCQSTCLGRSAAIRLIRLEPIRACRAGCSSE
jgi:hypothetical protein